MIGLLVFSYHRIGCPFPSYLPASPSINGNSRVPLPPKPTAASDLQRNNTPLQELAKGPKRKAMLQDKQEDHTVGGNFKSEKKQKVDEESDISTSKRRGAVYLVLVPVPVNYDVLRTALAKLGSEIESLRRSSYEGDINRGTNHWVVKFVGVPKVFVKHVLVSNGVYATLTAGSGTTCLICEDSESDDSDHDMWECQYLDPDGEERPHFMPLSIRAPAPDQRTALDLAKGGEQSPRNSLFFRVTLPDGRRPDYPRRADDNPVDIENAQTKEARINRLVKKSKRCIFCRFKQYSPSEEQFLSIVRGGPVERVRTDQNSGVGFLDFVYPDDAERFLRYAILNINGTPQKFCNEKGILVTSRVEFMWSETPFKIMDPLLAGGIVNEAWTRVIMLRTVPIELEAKKIINDCGGREFLLWISEVGNYRDRPARDFSIEFTTIVDAKNAYKRLCSKGYNSSMFVEWGQEECTRGLP